MATTAHSATVALFPSRISILHTDYERAFQLETLAIDDGAPLGDDFGKGVDAIRAEILREMPTCLQDLQTVTVHAHNILELAREMEEVDLAALAAVEIAQENALVFLGRWVARPASEYLRHICTLAQRRVEARETRS